MSSKIMIGATILAYASVLSLAVSSPVRIQFPSGTDGVAVENYSPYDFGFEFGDGLGMSQYRKETADGNGLVQGSYGYVDPDGLYRSVEYKADSDGFQAVVKSNEPGLRNEDPANANFIVEPPPAEVAFKSTVSQYPVEIVKVN